MERDRVEVEDIMRRVSPPMRQYYVQMTIGKRSERLTPAALDAAAKRPAVAAVSRSVAAWRHMKVRCIVLVMRTFRGAFRRNLNGKNAGMHKCVCAHFCVISSYHHWRLSPETIRENLF